MFFITLLFSIIYFLILLFLTIGIWKIRKPATTNSVKQISVIVAARNEADNITRLIKHLSGQNYPIDNYEIIIVDDRSSDRTSEIVSEMQKNIKNLFLHRISPSEPGGKKRALVKGISNARSQLLAFTDADCLPEENWLAELSRHIADRVDFVAGYSPLVEKKKSLLLFLKNLERISIFAVSAGGIGWGLGLTCTGRNMAYRRSLYDKVGGFADLEDIPSGDDDLMIQRMTSLARKMTFMFTPGSIVPSFDNKTIKDQIHMETRRASKWRLYPGYIKIGTFFVFLYYFCFMIMIILLLSGKITEIEFLILLSIKVIAELLILMTYMSKIAALSYLLFYPLALFLHLPYFLFFALKGTFGSYRWKN